jgi:FixJ family two-component response regulator
MDAVAAVHVVDDDQGFLVALCRFLRAAGFTVVSCDSATSLLALVSGETRGCIVADLQMPGIGGLELQQLLAGRGIALPMVFLTGQGTVPTSVRAMRDGAVDFLEKLAPREELLAAIVRALHKDAEGHAARLLLEERRRRLAALTERELEVLGLVVRGLMNKQIAAQLGIHERTVKLHRTAITSKLGVHPVAQLAIFASEARLSEMRPSSRPERRQA